MIKEMNNRTIMPFCALNSYLKIHHAEVVDKDLKIHLLADRLVEKFESSLKVGLYNFCYDLSEKFILGEIDIHEEFLFEVIETFSLRKWSDSLDKEISKFFGLLKRYENVKINI